MIVLHVIVSLLCECDRVTNTVLVGPFVFHMFIGSTFYLADFDKFCQNNEAFKNIYNI